MLNSNIYQHELRQALMDLPVDKFDEKKILITGATGMLCSCVVDLLLEMRRSAKIDIQIIATSRNVNKLKARFYEPTGSELRFMEYDATLPLAQKFQIDYIIHGASYADPNNFAQYPVETMLSNILGTNNLLTAGLQGGMKRFLYISSGEFYGQPDADMNDFREDYSGYVDYRSPRACYPSGKRGSEVLCQSFIQEYGVDCVIVRPCHLFGPTMTRTDSRAVSEFLRNALNGKDIVLKSTGLLERSHCYVVDAAKAILFVLMEGLCGEAYNIADPRYQITLRSFAEIVAEAGGVSVVYKVPTDFEKRGYSQIKKAVLDSQKLIRLGWKPNQDKTSHIVRTLQILKEIQE